MSRVTSVTATRHQVPKEGGQGQGWIALRIAHGRVLVDVGDLAVLEPFRWRVWTGRSGEQYARTNVVVDGRTRPLLMHRLLMGLTWGDGLAVDHRDGDGLNNRRYNLRLATSEQNARNRKSTNKWGYKGVMQDPEGYFRGCIRVEKRRVFSKGFDTPEEAARWYDHMAQQHFGEFARINFERAKP